MTVWTNTMGANKEHNLQVILEGEQGEILIELIDNEATKEFVAMLPLELEWSDFTGKEKIADLPSKLQAKKDLSYIPQVGDFFYYVPWGNIGIFYKQQAPSDLVYLGKVISGLERLQKQNFRARISMKK